MFKKNRIITCAVCVAVAAIIAAVCLLPFPQKIDLVFYGCEVAADGTVLDKPQIVLNATRYNYLLKDDVYHHISIEIDGVQYDTSSYTTDIPLSDHPINPYTFIKFHFYDAEANQFNVCRALLGNDGTWVGVAIGTSSNSCRYFVGSIKENFDTAEIWEICKTDFVQ